MRKSLLISLLAIAAVVPLAVTGVPSHGYAQVGTVQGDEFNNDVFAAPFTLHCGANAYPTTCPDAQATNTWNLNREHPGFLRIYTQPGTLVGSSNNARNFVVEPYNPNLPFVVTTSLTFPATFTNNLIGVGQTAGIIAYLNDDNFITVDRTYNGSNFSSQLEFRIEQNGQDQVVTVNEPQFQPTVYLQLTKTANLYTAAYSYDAVNFTQFYAAPAATATPTLTPTATSAATAAPTYTPAPTSTPTIQGFAADYTSGQPQVGVFGWGGNNAAVVNAVLPADFDWFRSGLNFQTPAPTALPTLTGTPSSTSTPTVTATAAATNTALPTATSTNTAVPPTATASPTATNTAVPTPTPVPPKPANNAQFQYVSVWYHTVRQHTFNHIEVQSKQKSEHGIWVHVYFPTGIHFNYFENTDGRGHWTKEFNIPSNAISRYSNEAVVTFQLWKGKSTSQQFRVFTVIP